MHNKLTIMLVFIAIIGGLIPPSVTAVSQAQKSIIKHAEDFDKDTIKTFNELFKDCPAGTILYKLNGEMVIICLIDSVHGVLVSHDGSQTTNINIHIDEHNKKKSGHHHNDGNSSSNNETTDGPDKDCLFNASLPKCDPDKDGNCPDGFNLNEDGNCFPDHHETGCPEGSHGVDDDETGQCYKDDKDCPDGMELNDDGNCRYINEEEQEPVVITPPTTDDEQEQLDNIQDLEMASDDEATPQEPVSTDNSSDNDDGGQQQDSNEEDNSN